MELLGAGPWTRPAAPPVPGGRRPGAGEITRRRVSFSDVAVSGRVSAVRILPLSGVCDVGFLSLSQYARVCFCTSKEVAATQTLAPKCLGAHLQGKKTSSHTTSVPWARLRKSTVSVRRGPVRLPAPIPTSSTWFQFRIQDPSQALRVALGASSLQSLCPEPSPASFYLSWPRCTGASWPVVV